FAIFPNCSTASEYIYICKSAYLRLHTFHCFYCSEIPLYSLFSNFKILDAMSHTIRHIAQFSQQFHSINFQKKIWCFSLKCDKLQPYNDDPGPLATVNKS